MGSGLGCMQQARGDVFGMVFDGRGDAGDVGAIGMVVEMGWAGRLKAGKSLSTGGRSTYRLYGDGDAGLGPVEATAGWEVQDLTSGRWDPCWLISAYRTRK